EFAAERSRHHGNRNAAMQVGAFALEEWMRANREEDIKIAGRSAANAGFAFTGEADAGAVLAARWHIHRQRAFAGDAVAAAAHRTGLRFGPGFGAGAGAGLTSDRGRNADLRSFSAECLLQRDLHVVTQIGAALAPAGTAAARRHTENAFKQIREGGAEIGA